MQITCNTTIAYNAPDVMLCATWYEGTAQLLSLTELKSHFFELFILLAEPLTDEGGEGNRSTRKKTLATSFRFATSTQASQGCAHANCPRPCKHCTPTHTIKQARKNDRQKGQKARHVNVSRRQKARLINTKVTRQTERRKRRRRRRQRKEGGQR